MDKGKEAPAQNGLDPDLARLLKIEVDEPAVEPSAPSPPDFGDTGEPDFHTLFSEEKPEIRPTRWIPPRTKFPTIIKIQEDPKPFFQDKDYYKKVLAGEGEEGTRVHELLGKYMKAEDPEEKSRYRAQLISAFWELGARIAYRAGRDLIMPKRLLLRFGILPPVSSPPSSRTWCPGSSSRTRPGSRSSTWTSGWSAFPRAGPAFHRGRGEAKGKDAGQKILDAVEKKKGQRDSEVTLLKAKISQLDEREARSRARWICSRATRGTRTTAA